MILLDIILYMLGIIGVALCLFGLFCIAVVVIDEKRRNK